MQKSDIKIGMLFRYNKRLSIHGDVHGHIGIVLAKNAQQVNGRHKYPTNLVGYSLVYGGTMKKGDLVMVIPIS